jgi:hypothetical protein
MLSAVLGYCLPFLFKSAAQKVFQKLGATRIVTLSKFHTEDPHTLGATVHNLIATATWHPGFVNAWFKCNEALHLKCMIQFKKTTIF